MAKLFHYQLFGLNITSELFLSHLDESEFSHPDLLIKNGSVAATLENYADRGVFYFAAPGKFLFEMDKIGRFMVNDGKEIIVQKHKGADYSELMLFLLGSVIGAALLQKGMIPLHGSSVAKQDKSLVFCGKSGAGKSSLAAEFIRKGYGLLSDDISVIDWQDEIIKINRGIQQLKLWADSINSLKIDSSQLKRVRPSMEKYYVPQSGSLLRGTSGLNAIVILEVKNSPGYIITELSGIEKFQSIRSNIYRGIYIEPLGLTDHTFKAISNIAEKVKVYRVGRPLEPLNIKQLASFIDNRLMS